jgi:bacterioferritin (cytochrome b1)
MDATSASILNQLLAKLLRSLPQYLRWSRPHVPPGAEAAFDVVESAAKDQDVLADRIARMLMDAEVVPRTGEFPMEFTDLHDLDIEYLLKLVVERQIVDVAAIEQLVQAAEGRPTIRAVAEEVLGLAKGHLDALRECRLHEPAA